MTAPALPPIDDGTACDCCGCDPEAQHGASLLGLSLCVAALATLIGLALLVRGAVVGHESGATRSLPAHGGATHD